MNIKINGEDFTVEDLASITQIIEKLEIKDKVLAVAQNGVVVKKDKWDSTQVEDGDKLELLEFVGGG